MTELPERTKGETFAAFVERIGNPCLDDNWDVLFQMPFIHDGMRGTADFIERCINEETGAVSFEPIDSKLTRKEAKPGHVLQLCFYADGIEALSGITPARVHLELGSGHSEALRVADFRPYWRRLRRQLATELDAGSDTATEPQPCAHCQSCEFKPMCDKQWRDERSTVLVARIRADERLELAAAGTTTINELAQNPPMVESIKEERYAWLQRQAALQCAAEARDGMPYDVLDKFHDGGEPEDDDYKHRLPRPDRGDIFIDFEGHPLWTIEQRLFFLFGSLEHGDDDELVFLPRWAHSREDERAASWELIDYLAERRRQYPGMHVYHYNNTERTTLEGLADGNPIAEAKIKALFETGAFVDLYRTVLKYQQSCWTMHLGVGGKAETPYLLNVTRPPIIVSSTVTAWFSVGFTRNKSAPSMLISAPMPARSIPVRCSKVVTGRRPWPCNHGARRAGRCAGIMPPRRRGGVTSPGRSVDRHIGPHFRTAHDDLPTNFRAGQRPPQSCINPL